MHPTPVRRAAASCAFLAGLLTIALVATGPTLVGSATPQARADDRPAPAAARPAVLSRRDLEGMRLGLMMLEPNARRALADAGVEAEPGALSLDQLAAVHGVLSRAPVIGPEERERIVAIVRP